jgi:hypothetical protein
MKITEATGPGLKLSREARRKAELDHLEIFAHPDSTDSRRMWLIEAHRSPRDRNPSTHEFDDGHDMLRFVAEHAAVPEPAEEKD